MTGASTGLHKALARAGSSVVAIAEMQTDELLAQMTDEQKAALAASLAPSAEASAAAGAAPSGNASDDGDADDMKCSKCSEPMKDGKCEKCSPDSSAEASTQADPVAAARAEERQRFNTVMSSEHYKGRESLAATLLGNDKLGADEIVAALASASAAPAENAADAEAGASLLNAMKAFGNPDTADAKTGNQQQANHGWADIHAEIRERRGL